jgi:hypothetical protein
MDYPALEKGKREIPESTRELIRENHQHSRKRCYSLRMLELRIHMMIGRIELPETVTLKF